MFTFLDRPTVDTGVPAPGMSAYDWRFHYPCRCCHTCTLRNICDRRQGKMNKQSRQTPLPSVTPIGAGIFTINDCLLPGECAAFIAASEAINYTEAVISTDDGERLIKDARNNDRILRNNKELSARLFRRAMPFLPAEIDG